MCASLDSPERGDAMEKVKWWGPLRRTNLGKLDIGRGSSKGGVDRHARWFEDAEPLFLKIS